MNNGEPKLKLVKHTATHDGSSDTLQQTLGARPKKHSNHIAWRELFQFRCSPQWLTAIVGAGVGVGIALWCKSHQQRGWRSVFAVGGMGLLAAMGYAIMLEPRQPVLERVVLKFPRFPTPPSGLRIGHLSDFHLGLPFAKANTRWAVARLMEERPDLIVITGDFVSFRHAIPLLPQLLAGLQAPLGVYAVAGNHDHWEGLDAIRAHLEPLGIAFLMNRNVRLQWQGVTFWLAGIDDIWYGRTDFAGAMEGIPKGAFVILLAHAPDVADQAATYPIALQLSGHTHGGHLYLPGLGWFCVPFYGLHYISGVSRVGTMQVYVSRGLGGLPMRLNCRPEVTVLTIAADDG